MDWATAAKATIGRCEGPDNSLYMQVFFLQVWISGCEKPKCTSSGPNDWFIDFRFVLFRFQFNCRLQCSTEAQIIIQNSGEFQKTLNLAICSTQIAVIVIISLFVEHANCCQINNFQTLSHNFICWRIAYWLIEKKIKKFFADKLWKTLLGCHKNGLVWIKRIQSDFWCHSSLLFIVLKYIFSIYAVQTTLYLYLDNVHGKLYIYMYIHIHIIYTWFSFFFIQHRLLTACLSLWISVVK